nr:MAG TPA: hypothetical protein [Caudoviricetes sp.]
MKYIILGGNYYEEHKKVSSNYRRFSVSYDVNT